MEPEEIDIPPPNIVLKPTADIALLKDDSGVVQSESYAVIPKNNSKNEYLRPVKMSDLLRIKKQAATITEQNVKWDEFALGISTLGFGSTLSALASSVALNTTLGVLFYIISPVLSFSLAVFVVMYKVLRTKTDKNSAEIILQIVEPYEEAAQESTNEPQ